MHESKKITKGKARPFPPQRKNTAQVPGWRSKRRPEQTTAPVNPAPEQTTAKVEVKHKPEGKLEDRPKGEAYRRRNESEELQPFEP